VGGKICHESQLLSSSRLWNQIVPDPTAVRSFDVLLDMFFSCAKWPVKLIAIATNVPAGQLLSQT